MFGCFSRKYLALCLFSVVRFQYLGYLLVDILLSINLWFFVDLNSASHFIVLSQNALISAGKSHFCRQRLAPLGYTIVSRVSCIWFCYCCYCWYCGCHRRYICHYVRPRPIIIQIYRTLCDHFQRFWIFIKMVFKFLSLCLFLFHYLEPRNTTKSCLITIICRNFYFVELSTFDVRHASPVKFESFKMKYFLRVTTWRRHMCWFCSNSVAVWEVVII